MLSKNIDSRKFRVHAASGVSIPVRKRHRVVGVRTEMVAGKCAVSNFLYPSLRRASIEYNWVCHDYLWPVQKVFACWCVECVNLNTGVLYRDHVGCTGGSHRVCGRYVLYVCVFFMDILPGERNE